MTAQGVADALVEDEAPEQRRVLRVLVAAQVLSGAGLAAGITVGALLARQMLQSTSLAGMPALVFTLGAAGASVAIGAASQRSGRRAGLALGYLAGSVGSLGVLAAAALDSPALLFASLFVYGAGSAANLQARYAGGDLASPHRRGRAISLVLVATTLGAVLGPNLAEATGAWADALGVPRLAGPFILAAAAYGVGAAVLAVWLRPDPLLLARARQAAIPVPRVPQGQPSPTGGPDLRLGALVMVVAQMVMIAIMTMTPVHMMLHGHGVRAVGVVIGIHVAAMYLPSPVSGWLVDRVGPRPVAASSAAVLLSAGVAAAVAPPHSVAWMSVALALLGIGWSLGLVAGTVMVAAAAPTERRASVQGRADFLIALAGASGGALSGLVVDHASYSALALGGGVLALALLPVLLRSRGRERAPAVGLAD